MYGKSYDGVTGLIGVNQRRPGSTAVVSQEPVYDLYRYLYGDGIRRAELGRHARALRRDRLHARGRCSTTRTTTSTGSTTPQRPGCLAPNLADQAGNDDHDSDYWRTRNLIPGAKGSDVPLFLTQGLTENNTVADGTAQYLDNHTGYERAWLGPWEHVRGNETRRERPPEDGPRGLLRRGHALLRPLPQGRDADGAGPAGRGADQRRQVARRGAVAAGRRRAASRRRSAPAATPTTAPAPRPATATETGVWTISKPLPYDVAPRGLGPGGRRRGDDAARTPTSWSTSTTSTRTARAR